MPTTAINPEIEQCYLDALRLQFDAPRSGRIAASREIGRKAMVAGCDTLELARMHERALIALAPDYDFAKISNGLHRRTGRFFPEVLVPLERAHHDTRESLKKVQQRAETLRLAKAELAKANRQLKREVKRRKGGGETIRKGKEHYQQLFVRSQFMQKKIRHLTRQILAAQENERRKISWELHDEVVQTLVGINVELAALLKASSLGVRALKAKIVSTQRLVEKSVRAMHQFARELRPAVLDDLGLIPAIHAYMKNLAKRKN